MVRISNGIITALNILTFIISLAAIALSFWLVVKTDTPCQKILQKPLLFVGLALLVVSFLGLIGSCCGFTFFMWIYLFILFFLILGLAAFTIFTIVVTNTRVGNALSKRGVGEHRLGDYSKWLQNYVINVKNWDQIKRCLVDIHACNINHQLIYIRNLSPIQSGCCKPPSACGFESKNATLWTIPKKGPSSSDKDCNRWSNVQKQLCFDCDSCRVAVLDNIKKDWKIIAIVNSIILVIVVIVYSIGCCALRSNSSRGYQKYRGGA